MPGTTQWPPHVHYIWVGPPPTGNNAPMATIGPDLMVKKDPSRNLHYWCLSEYVAHYTKYFQKSPVTVHAIESYVEKRKTELYVLINKIKEAALFSSTASDTARHYVTIKELTQYFLPINFLNYGYFLDTNILPCQDLEACYVLPALDYYSIPKAARGVDPFMQYSPQNELKQSSEARFNYYFREVSTIYSCSSNTNTRISAFNRLKVTQAFVSAGRAVKENLRHLTAECLDVDRSLYRMVDIGVEKRYWNTHKHDAASQIPASFYTVLTDHATEELRYMIAYGLDVNATFNISINDDQDDIYPTCLAYQAILENKKKQLAMLLEHISNFDTAYDGPFVGYYKLTLLELAKLLNHTECISLINQAKEKQNTLNQSMRQAIASGQVKRLKELLAVFPDLNITLSGAEPPITLLALAEQSGNFECIKQIYLAKIKRCTQNKNDDERLALILQEVNKARRCSIFTWCCQQGPVLQAKSIDELLTEVVKNPGSEAKKAMDIFLEEPVPSNLRSEFSCPPLRV